MSPSEIKSLACKVIQQESASVAALVDQIGDTFVQTAEMLLACKGHVLVAGSGTSNAVASRLAHLLSCCGTPSLFIHPGDSQHGLAGAITENDVLIALSKGGETTEINFLARFARERGTSVVAFTENPHSTLARLSDVTLRVCATTDVDPFGMIATGSSLTNAALGDALCVTLLYLRGYTEESFSKTHPGGAVGQKIKTKKPETP